MTLAIDPPLLVPAQVTPAFPGLEVVPDAPDLRVLPAPAVVPAQAVLDPARPLPGVSLVRRSQVRVERFWVEDLGPDELVAAVLHGALRTAGVRPFRAYALHVGGLNARQDPAYAEAMRAADVVYADGMSVVWLGRLAGAGRVERTGTTDIGWRLLAELGSAVGRPARVALVGGPDGLAERAGAVLEARLGVEVVAAEHGYHEDWTEVTARLAASGCDVLVVGMGAPREMVWVSDHLAALPRCLTLTCGGWFGFLTEDERRAPGWMQSAGLEWSYRLAQAPRRLAGRYARGAVTTAALAGPLLLDRLRGRG